MQTISSHPHRGKALALSALACAALIAGCGSSESSSKIKPGAQNPHAAAEVEALEKAESKSSTSTSTTSTSSTASTPTSGPLSKKPKVTVPTGPAPSKTETKEIIKGTGPEAKAGDSVTVNYVGVLYKTGKEFDSSWSRNEPFSFTLGKKQVIEGWDKGVVGMRVGGRRELIIPASEAYKSQGQGSIPPNEALVFVVDLLGV